MLSILTVVTGHIAAVEEDAAALVEALRTALRSDTALEVVLVLDGPEWSKTLDVRPGGALKVITAEAGSTPAAMYNQALAAASGSRVAFAWPGVDFGLALRFLRRLHRPAEQDDIPFIASWCGAGETRRLPPHSWLQNESDQLPLAFPLGWLQLCDLVPMHESVVDIKLARKLRFNESPALQAGFWWDFCLRAAREGDVICQGLPASAATSWWEHPFARTTFKDGDSVARLLMDMQSVAPVLKLEDGRDGRTRGLSPVLVDGSPLQAPWERKLKVTILGGVNEPAHNQLCFFNYFERLREAGWLEWRTVLDTAAHDLDILRSDLVIFSRVKSQPGRRLMDLAVRQGVPTLYMIDDNWFRVAEDFPIYREAFAPNAPFTQVFMHCLDQADLTLTYNPILRDDVKPHARETAMIETNIDLTLFPRERRAVEKNRTTLGYVGSMRTDTLAIEALCDVVEADESLDLFFMSGMIPDAVKRLPEERLKTSTYIFDYARYAQTVCEASPDILIAPLGDTMFERSKCPNKYLEITAAGALGVYSDNELYRRYIKGGETGFFTPQHTRRSWRQSIEEAVQAGPAKRRQMVERAYADVRDNFRTETRLADLVEVMGRALRLGRERAVAKQTSAAGPDAPSDKRALQGAAA